MDLTNIPADVIDSHYRYKRPLVKLGFVSTKGGQTIVKNFKEILTSLRLTQGSGDISQSTVDFTKKVVSQFRSHFKCTVSLTDNGLSISSQVNTAQVEELFEKIIHKSVLCNNCFYPELVYKMSGNSAKDTKISAKCNACGNKMKDIKI